MPLIMDLLIVAEIYLTLLVPDCRCVLRCSVLSDSLGLHGL